jgi:hypothetical protein
VPPGEPVLVAAAPLPIGVLKRGTPGQVSVTVRNTGAGGADNLVATVRLPDGFTVRAGSGSNGWRCTGAGTVATCTREELDAGESTTLHVRADVGADAPLAGTVDGTVTTAGTSTPVPPKVLAILP